MKSTELKAILAKLPPESREMVELLFLQQADESARESAQLVDALAWRDEHIRLLELDLKELRVKFKELTARLNQNSRNSSKPPSSDQPHHSESEKEKKEKKEGKQGKKGKKNKGKRKPGGQPGHPGNTLRMVPSEQTEVIDHYPEVCEGCGKSLKHPQSHSFARRQVFDTLPIKLEVREHRSHQVVCSCCHCESQGAFPQEATNQTCYGPNLRTLAVYLLTYQLLPHARTAEMIADITGQPVSEGTLDKMVADADAHSGEFIEGVTRQLQQAEVVGFDETGIRCDNQQHYAHVARTERHTLYLLGRRGLDTMTQMQVLPHFKGIAVHDRYSSYWHFGRGHGLCNVHHLRELEGLIEQDDEGWAKQLQQLLRKANWAVKRAKAQGKTAFSASTCADYRLRFQVLVDKGLTLHPYQKKPPGQKGRAKQSKAHNLLTAFDHYTDEVLRFLYDFRVPFDNNGSERDLRMLKVKMKISGYFKCLDTGNRFLRVRSLVSTARKQGYSSFEAIKALFSPQPEVFVLKLI